MDINSHMHEVDSGGADFNRENSMTLFRFYV